ncbi:hypothetical protein GOBAR_DD14787 [Gossypium barbadense]|nr:hypothetical protein GOBAR_DD14787 [Gossypium barbadense]
MDKYICPIQEKSIQLCREKRLKTVSGFLLKCMDQAGSILRNSTEAKSQQREIEQRSATSADHILGYGENAFLTVFFAIKLHYPTLAQAVTITDTSIGTTMLETSAHVSSYSVTTPSPAVSGLTKGILMYTLSVGHQHKKFICFISICGLDPSEYHTSVGGFNICLYGFGRPNYTKTSESAKSGGSDFSFHSRTIESGKPHL